MNAHTLVPPTKRYPCDFNRLANAFACGVEVGRSAMERGAVLRVLAPDLVARQLSILFDGVSSQTVVNGRGDSAAAARAAAAALIS